MEISDDKLLKLHQAYYDMVIRNCSMCHNDLVEYYKEKRLNSKNPETYTPDASYINLIKAISGVLVEAPMRKLSSFNGQVGLENGFVEGLGKVLKNKSNGKKRKK